MAPGSAFQVALRARELRERGTAAALLADPIAITGVGCRFPGAPSPEAFWSLLQRGQDAITEVPGDRWPTDAYYDPDPAAPGKTYSRWGGFLDDVKGFDAGFFGISRREATAMDPQQRILLEVCWEALERAGQPVARLSGMRASVFVGIGHYDYLSRTAGQAAMGIHTVTGNALCFAAGRVSYLLGLQGPSVVVETACSSSLVAVHLACQSLRTGEADLALAGGVNVLVAPDSTIAFSRMQALAHDGRCKTFDARADGFVRGEGCGVVVLKRLSTALADRDPIWAIIRGSAVNQDGRGGGLTVPNGVAQEEVIRHALRQAGVGPDDISYVETHGSGTALGDPIELHALAAALGGRRRDDPVWVGSVKTNIGHLEAAAGVAGLIKVVLAMRNGRIPPHLHFQSPSQHVEWDRIPLRVAADERMWPAGGGRRFAGVSAFGFSGTNAHVVLESAPDQPAASAPTDDVHVLTLSARTPAALAALAEASAAALSKVDAQLADICYSSSVRRSHYDHRLALPVSSAQNAADQLRKFSTGRQPSGVYSGVAPVEGADAGLVFVYSGQGPRWAGMGLALAQRSRPFRDALEACDAALRPVLGWSPVEVLHEHDDRLRATDVFQAVLFSLQIALTAWWRDMGLEPSAVVGHSAGEVAAAWAAGALGLEDAARVLAWRGRVLQAIHGRGAMLAVDRSADAMRQMLADSEPRLVVAAINSPFTSVVAGEVEAVARFHEMLVEQGADVHRVAVEVASHSPMVEPFARGGALELAGLAVHEPRIPIVSTVTGRWSGAADYGPCYWPENVRQPVRFADAVNTLLDSGARTFLEISPHPVLALPISQCASVRDQAPPVLGSMRNGAAELASLLQAAARLHVLGYTLRWERQYVDPHAFVQLPTYPWQHEAYWLEALPTTLAGPSVHPLLGQRVRSSLARAQYEVRISPETTPVVYEHRLGEVAIVPAAAYLEMAVAAANDLYGRGPVRLQDVAFRAPLRVTESRGCTLQFSVLTPPAGDAWRFQIASQDQEGRDWTVHVTGTLLPGGANAAVAPAELSAADRRCTVSVPVEAFYRELREAGLDLRGTFRGLQDLRISEGEGEAIGRTGAPAATSCLFHPGLLDSCLQVAGRAVPASAVDRDVYLPLELRGMDLADYPRGPLWSYAVYRAGQADTRETFAVDVVVTQADGSLVARLDELRFARRPAQLLDVDHMLFRVEWQASAATTQSHGRASETARRGSWLVLDDAGGVGAALGQRLAAAGHQVAYAPADSATDFAPLLAAAAPYTGIVHLWNLALDRTTAFERARQLGALSIARLVRAIAERGWRDPPRLVIVRGSECLSQSLVEGLAASLALEHPELRPRLVEVATDEPHRLAAALADELVCDDDEDRVALRDDRRWLARLRQCAAPPPRAMRVRSDGTYVITGGDGAIGRAIAGLLQARGAGHVVALSRRRGVDVADREELAAALRRIRTTLPPLRGVFHAAGVLDDALLLALDDQRFGAVARPKVEGAWNLHELTLEDDLDYFVLCSSAASVLGAPGQAHYAAANAFLDALARERHRQGLPALSVSWGAWSGAGLAGEAARRRPGSAARGISSFTPEVGLRLLERALATDEPHVVALRFDARQWVQYHPAAAKPFLSDLAQALPASTDGVLKRRLLTTPASQRAAALLEVLQQQAGEVVGSPAHQVDPDRALRSIGFDSLMTLEFRNRLEASLGLRLPATMIWNYPTLRALAAQLVDKLAQADGPVAPDPVESLAEAEVKQDTDSLRARVAAMSDAEAESLLRQRLTEIIGRTVA